MSNLKRSKRQPETEVGPTGNSCANCWSALRCALGASSNGCSRESHASGSQDGSQSGAEEFFSASERAKRSPNFVKEASCRNGAKCFGFLGLPGRGKTHFLAAVGHELIMHVTKNGSYSSRRSRLVAAAFR